MRRAPGRKSAEPRGGHRPSESPGTDGVILGPGASEREPLMTRPEVARYMSVSERTIWALTTSGALKHIRIGRAVRYRRADVDRFLERHTRGGRR